MPYYIDPKLKDEEEQGKLSESGGQGVVASGASPQMNNSGSAAGNKPNSGSGFQNIDSYLKANNAGAFGQKFLGNVESTIDKGAQAQKTASEGFKNQVQSANQLYDQDKLKSTLERPDQADASQFQKAMKQSYQGPNSLAENQNLYNQYWSGTNQAQAQAGALGTSGGRFALLDSYFGRPQYSMGQKSLDNALYQHSGAGKQAQGLQNEAAQLRGQGNLQAQGLQSVAAQRKGEVEKNVQDVNAAYTAAQAQAQDSVRNALTDANAKRLSEQNRLKDALASNQISDEDLMKLGLSRGQATYDLNPLSYLSVNSNPLVAEQVASDEQRARLNALAQLAGQEQSFLGGQLDRGSDYSFDMNRFNTDLGAADSRYQTALKATPVQLSTSNGQAYTRTMEQLQNEIQASKDAIARGDSPSVARNFLAQAEPAYQRALQQINNQFGNKLGTMKVR